MKAGNNHFQNLCHQAIKKHNIPENHYCNLIKRTSIMAIENGWSDEEAVIKAIQCVKKEMNYTE